MNQISGVVILLNQSVLYTPRPRTEPYDFAPD